MMKLEYILTFISGIFLTAAPFMFAIRKSKADTVTTEIENAHKVVLMWRETTEAIQLQLTKAEETNRLLMAELGKMKDTHESVLRELHSLRMGYSKLEKSYKELKDQLKSNNENYEK